jgi:serine/threonine-protein kinase RIO1
MWKRRQLRDGRRSRLVKVREMNLETVRADAIEGGLADEVVTIIGTGKEADVYLALWKGAPLALKVYRLHRTAQRKNSEIGYSQDRMGALAGKEFTTLQKAYQAGVPVPTPARRADNMFTMRFIGETSKAPQLKDVELDDPSSVTSQALAIVNELFKASIVHGDLSEYNLLMAGDRLFVIDFLQSIDFSSRVNRHAQLEKAKPLLMRDLKNLERYFLRYAIKIDAASEYERLLSAVEQ